MKGYDKFAQEDSDEDGETQFDVEEAVKKAEFINFSDSRETAIGSFEDRYKRYLVKRRNFSKVIHKVAEKKSWSEEQISGFLKWMLATFTEPILSLFQCLHPESSNTPLLTALKKKNGRFVQVLLDMARDRDKATGAEKSRNLQPTEDNSSRKDKDAAETSLMKTVLTAIGTERRNCLHMAVLYKSDVFDRVLVECENYPDLFTQADEDGDTPLHYAVSQFDDAHKLVYKEGQVQFLKPPEMNTGNGQGNGQRHNLQVQIPSPAALSRKGTFDDTKSTPSWTFTLYNAMKLLLTDHGKKALVVRNSRLENTPYQTRLYNLANKLRQEYRNIDIEKFIREAEILDPMADYIRFFCIQHLSREELTRALYKPGEERQIEFDLGGLPNSSISRRYLERLTEHLRFECILKYVKLPGLLIEAHPPVISPGAKEAMAQKNTQSVKYAAAHTLPQVAGISNTLNSEASKKQVEGVQAIFNWLRQNKVRRILKVEVIDDAVHPHSDEVIERSMEGMGVEEWDWRKLDLCSDVIATSTNVVRQISLFSSGNNAVLMGWSSSDGFLNIEKFPKTTKLEVVRLFIREGSEESKRLEKYISDFKLKLKDRRQIRVAFGVDRTNPTISSFLNFDGNIQLESDWMACLRMFATFINTVPKTDTEPIRFAIIDDGIDNSLEIFAGKIAGGQSFCPYPNSTDLRNSYFVPSGRHGTIMASLICRLCPRASLCIARLEERFTTQGRRRIGPKSAADAVRWAVDCNVDIISMSWTIEMSDGADLAELDPLQNAIKAAEDKNILMFCSASDQGSSSNDRCFPGEWGKCLRIGASTETGEPFSWVHGQPIDFLMPGEITFNDGTSSTYQSGTSSAYRSGSSIATAIASGLAGLILHCQEILEGKESKDYQGLKTRLGMKSAFQKMTGGKKERFPLVRSFLEPAKFEEKDWIIDSEVALANLTSMMKRIQSKV